MSAWAYRCHPCVEGEADWFVSQLDVEQLGPDVRIVRVRVGGEWKCALLDRTQPVVVENQLLRDVIAAIANGLPNAALIRLDAIFRQALDALSDGALVRAGQAGDL